MKIKNSKTGKMEDVRLPKKFKAKWIKALKSGKYKQGEGQLCNSDAFGNESFCCIGVACRLQHPRFEQTAGLVSKKNYDYVGSVENNKIPKILKGSHVTLDSDFNPVVKKLVSMNDGVNGETKKTFTQIANWIAKNL